MSKELTKDALEKRKSDMILLTFSYNEVYNGYDVQQSRLPAVYKTMLPGYWRAVFIMRPRRNTRSFTFQQKPPGALAPGNQLNNVFTKATKK